MGMNFSEYLINVMRMKNVEQTLSPQDAVKENERIINASGFLKAGEEELAIIDFEAILDEENKKNEEDLTDEQQTLNDIIKTLLEIEDIQKLVDTNTDGKLSNDEIIKFLKEIMELDGNFKDFSLDDINSALEKYGIDLNSILTGDVDTALESIGNTYDSASEAYTTGSTSGGGSYGNYGGGGNSYDLLAQNNPNSIENLEKQKSEMQTNLNNLQSEIGEINSGTSERVAVEKQAVEDAKIAMDEAIKNDESIAQQLKDEKLKVENDITEKETAISNQETLISGLETLIGGLEGEITNLEAALSSVPEPKIVKDEDGKITFDNTAEIEARKADLRAQIDAKKGELEQAKTELEAAQKLLNDELKPALEALKEEKTRIDEEIKATAGVETRAAMEAYDNAKSAFESAKAAAIGEVQASIKTEQAKINELDTKIQEAKNKKLDTTERDLVIEKAQEYMGKSAAEMKAIMQAAGYQYNEGAWCADFVRFVTHEALGKSNLPDWYVNCGNLSYCPTIDSAGTNAGARVDLSQAQPGDLILFDWDGGTSDHIGIYMGQKNGKALVLEGNTSLGTYSARTSQTALQERNPSTIKNIYSLT